MSTFIKYLKMKHLLGFCSVIENRLLFDAPGVLSDNLFTSALRAKYSGVQLNILLQRIKSLQSILQQEHWSANLYYTYDNCVAYEFTEIRRSIRKVKKYSGYVRNPSSVGSKRFSKDFAITPETFEWNTNEELDFFEFLTVGKFSGSHLEILFPDDEPKSSKR
jgi:hypothetical protein